MGAAQLMVKSLRPKLIIMEVFVDRLRACNVRDFLGAFGQLNYTMDVSPRLNMPYCSASLARCTQLSAKNGCAALQKLRLARETRASAA
jgi:hypothetical protein